MAKYQQQADEGEKAELAGGQRRPPANATLSSDRIAALVTPSGHAAISVSRETAVHNTHFLMVGRQAATADLRIQHGSISRQHAMLYYDDSTGTLTVQDLGGKHGTTINGTRIEALQPIPLQHGDTIQFGNVRESVFTVQRSGRGPPVPSSDETTERGKGEEQEQQQQPPPTVEEKKSTEAAAHQETTMQIQRAGEGLTGRAKHEAEIAAMMASLDETPTYQKVQQEEPPQRTATFSATAAAAAAAAASTSSKDDEIATKFRIPIADQLLIPSESDKRRNTITCLMMDPSGSRFVVGSTDNHLRLYDFGGMDNRHTHAFKTVLVEDGYWPVDCSYSNTGDRVLVGTGSAQPTIVSREGESILQFTRGDMYVTDPAKTTGHTAAVTSVCWHPLERDIVLTASRDGSARLWNVKSGKKHFSKLVCDKVFAVKNANGQRTPVTFVVFHPGGREFAVGTEDGSIQIWNRDRHSGRPERAAYGAHKKNGGGAISSLVYSLDGTKLASRSASDDSVKIWNAQKLSRSSNPMVTCTGLHGLHEHANCALSPDAKVLCAGVSQMDDGGEMGFLHFYDISGHDDKDVVGPLLSVDLGLDLGGAIMVQWHPKINQILAGCSSGQCVVLFDSRFSKKGALVAMSKAGKRVDELSELLRSKAPTGSAAVTGEIIVPLYRDNLGVRRKRGKPEDPTKSREPERPITGKHKTGSQPGGSLNFQQFVAGQSMSKAKEIAGKDPREALFKYSEDQSNKKRKTDEKAENQED